MNPSVLIVDDDPVMRDLLGRFLRSHQFDVAVLHDGKHLQRRLERERPSIVVLDIMMPETDGLDAIVALRAGGDDIPVIFVTARGSVTDRIRGLTLGADDYLPKPFDPHELLVRIQNILRRRGPSTATVPEVRKPYRFGPFELDFTMRTLSNGGRQTALRESEFALLKVFAMNPYKVMSRTLIHDIVHREERAFRERSLDVPIWRLRRVIEIDPSKPLYIQTVRGKGYIFVPDPAHGAGASGRPSVASYR
ncbi:MAG TPA: response regulator [Paraburkholderia sp.]|jgi:two-component system phosphate regulon response regulator OmpR|nr:response regulator [Paraburkholderia sp.]